MISCICISKACKPEILILMPALCSMLFNANELYYYDPALLAQSYCVVMLLCFIFMDSEQPRNQQKFEPFQIKYPYSVIITN